MFCGGGTGNREVEKLAARPRTTELEDLRSTETCDDPVSGSRTGHL